TQALVVAAGLLELHVLADHGHDVRLVADLSDHVVRNHACAVRPMGVRPRPLTRLRTMTDQNYFGTGADVGAPAAAGCGRAVSTSAQTTTPIVSAIHSPSRAWIVFVVPAASLGPWSSWPRS